MKRDKFSPTLAQPRQLKRTSTRVRREPTLRESIRIAPPRLLSSMLFCEIPIAEESSKKHDNCTEHDLATENFKENKFNFYSSCSEYHVCRRFSRHFSEGLCLSKFVVWNNCPLRRSRFSEAILKTSPDIAKDAHQYHQRISS